jgi:hypothetical protein
MVKSIIEQLENVGYKQRGNWWYHQNLSIEINLLTKLVRSMRDNVLFKYIFTEKVSFEEVEKIRLFIESLN